jgi:hypothetical protein
MEPQRDSVQPFNRTVDSFILFRGKTIKNPMLAYAARAKATLSFAFTVCGALPVNQSRYSYYTKIEFQGHPHQQETHLGKYRSKNHLLKYVLLTLLD